MLWATMIYSLFLSTEKFDTLNLIVPYPKYYNPYNAMGDYDIFIISQY